jgi:TRAP-type transport system small permease protein
MNVSNKYSNTKSMNPPLLSPGPNAPAPIRALGVVVDWAIVTIGAVMVALVFINVVTHAFGKDMAATTELCELLMVWVTFLGGAAAARRGAHMSINEFLDKLTPEKRRWADAAIGLACVALLALLVWFGISITRTGLTNELTVLQISMAWQYAALPVGAAAMLVFVAWDTWLTLRGVSREERYAEANASPDAKGAH